MRSLAFRSLSFVIAASCVALACTSLADPVREAPVDGGSQETPDAGAPDAPDAERRTPRPLPALPLHTESRWILDPNGQRFKLASVSWYGAESEDFVVAGLDKAKLATLAESIRVAGFNSVRLPWSNELVEKNPAVSPGRVTANPELAGKPALEVLDRVIEALAFEGLVVILDNHVSRADWCCTETDGNGLWFSDAYPESSWLADWRTMVKRYASQPAVVGVDLRNEPRGVPDGRKPNWNGGDALDWRAAAKRGGDAVLAENPNLLVMVQGIDFSVDFTGVFGAPLQFEVPGRLVWSPHDYGFFHPNLASFEELKTDLGNKWGYLLVQGQPYTAPVWVGEFGVAHAPAEVASIWFSGIRRYLDESDIDWGYWPLNGTQATGTTRTLGAEESYGFLDPTWTRPALPELSVALQAIMPVKQTP